MKTKEAANHYIKLKTVSFELAEKFYADVKIGKTKHWIDRFSHYAMVYGSIKTER